MDDHTGDRRPSVLDRQIEARRNDKRFMARLQLLIAENRRVLERLAR